MDFYGHGMLGKKRHISQRIGGVLLALHWMDATMPDSWIPEGIAAASKLIRHFCRGPRKRGPKVLYNQPYTLHEKVYIYMNSKIKFGNPPKYLANVKGNVAGYS